MVLPERDRIIPPVFPGISNFTIGFVVVAAISALIVVQQERSGSTVDYTGSQPEEQTAQQEKNFVFQEPLVRLSPDDVDFGNLSELPFPTTEQLGEGYETSADTVE